MVASATGTGDVLWSKFTGTGYAGHFIGGQGVLVDGKLQVDDRSLPANIHIGSSSRTASSLLKLAGSC